MRFPLLGAMIVLSAAMVGTVGHPAAAQSSDSIQDQTLAPPPNTDPSKDLGVGAIAAPPLPAVPLPAPLAAPVPNGAPAAPVAAPTVWLPKTTAQLTILDKIYGTSSNQAAPIGAPFNVRFLTVSVLACWVRPPDLPPDAAVFLQISDSRASAGAPPEFRGWIFKAEPALSGLSDPVTDISVESCH
jgi:hypothetical protein